MWYIFCRGPSYNRFQENEQLGTLREITTWTKYSKYSQRSHQEPSNCDKQCWVQKRRKWARNGANSRLLLLITELIMKTTNDRSTQKIQRKSSGYRTWKPNQSNKICKWKGPSIRSHTFGLYFYFREFTAAITWPCSKAWLRIRETDVKGSKIPHGLKL